AAAGKIAPAVGDAVKAGAGYSNETRDAMDDLVEKTR
ncbi:MAG: CvpA family protein, partial [Caulobacteraceae bacterium]|nr:CvpA family protein [Caulobacteraceae bacterium]